MAGSASQTLSGTRGLRVKLAEERPLPGGMFV